MALSSTNATKRSFSVKDKAQFKHWKGAKHTLSPACPTKPSRRWPLLIVLWVNIESIWGWTIFYATSSRNSDISRQLFTTLEKKPFGKKKKKTGRGEKVGKQHFLLFAGCFLPFPKQISFFCSDIYFVTCKCFQFRPVKNFVRFGKQLSHLFTDHGSSVSDTNKTRVQTKCANAIFKRNIKLLTMQR